MIVTQADFRKISLGLRTIRGPLTMVKVVVKRLVSLLLRRKMYAMGNAIAIGLRKGLIDAEGAGPLRDRADRPARSRTAGSSASQVDARRRDRARVRARRGVILGSGGFERNLEMREKYQPQPDLGRLDDRLAVQHRRRHPRRHRGGRRDRPAGRRLVGPDDPAAERPVVLPGRAQPARLDHRQPGRRAVHERGAAVRRGRARDLQGRGHRRRPRAGAGWSSTSATATATSSPGLMPRQPFPGRWYKTASIKKAVDDRGARRRDRRAGRGAERRRVERFNGFAASGVDEDFHRGESAYDKYYSDPTVKPNPSLHVIDQAPFYAVKIVPGDLGTKGGLVTDERARVLRPDGSVIPGLYAAGNVSSAVMGHTYAGPGATIGPALAFGYLAAEDHRRHVVEARASQTRPTRWPDAHRPGRRDRRRRRHHARSRWPSSDVLLYHLGIGAGSRPGDNLDPAALRLHDRGPATRRCCRRSGSWRRRST